MSKVILINTSDLRANSYFDGNLEEQALITAIIVAQDTMLMPVLGSRLYKRIKTEVSSHTVSLEIGELIDDYITDTLIYYTAKQLALGKLFKITNQSVSKRDTDNGESATIEEMRYLMSTIRSIYTSYEERLKEYLLANTSLFPEYLENGFGEIESDDSNGSTIIFDIGSLKNDF